MVWPIQSRWLTRLPSLATLVAVAGLATVAAQTEPEFEQAPIRYSATAPSNLLSRIQPELETGGWRSTGAGEKDQVRALLGRLGVPEASQVLVFSKTSLQRQRIEPKVPRALYFSEDCYVGWVPGGLMEVAVTDPQLGLVFYRLDARDGTRPVECLRDPECLSCHAGPRTRGWPGLMVRSVFPDANGEPLGKAGSFLTGPESPLAERWGGWYVTGQHGAARHLGNALAKETGTGADLDREAGANVMDLSRFFRTDTYLRADSDIVALMVLEHQVAMHNRLVEGALRVRKWTYYQQQLQRELGEVVTEEPTGTALRVVNGEAERIVEGLLFCGEVRLPEGGIRGAGAFEKAFAQGRRADRRGRSLRDFDLKTRLFAYPCSYMIDSAAFQSLPEALKRAVRARLLEVLTSPPSGGRYGHLSAEDRRVVREILEGTGHVLGRERNP